MLKYNGTTKPSVKILSNHIPSVYFTRSAIEKMECYIEGCHMEIGWMCAATRNEENQILVYDAFLFKQQVHATTTEITPEGLAEFGAELLAQPDGMELWNNIRAWGHSHVNMAVFPSGQDDKQMAEFKETGFDWFVRIIGNKKGEMRVDLYDYEKHHEYHHLEWHILDTQEEEAFQKQADALTAEYEAQMNAIDAEIKALHALSKREAKALIDAEIKEKVSSLYAQRTYAQQSTYYDPVTRTYVPYTTTQTQLAIVDADDVKKNTTSVATKVNAEKEDAGNEDYDWYSEAQDAEFFSKSSINIDFYKFFHYADLFDMTEMDTTDELDEWLVANYPLLQFTQREKIRLLNYANDALNKWRG